MISLHQGFRGLDMFGKMLHFKISMSFQRTLSASVELDTKNFGSWALCEFQQDGNHSIVVLSGLLYIQRNAYAI